MIITTDRELILDVIKEHPPIGVSRKFLQFLRETSFVDIVAVLGGDDDDYRVLAGTIFFIATNPMYDRKEMILWGLWSVTPRAGSMVIRYSKGLARRKGCQVFTYSRPAEERKGRLQKQTTIIHYL